MTLNYETDLMAEASDLMRENVDKNFVLNKTCLVKKIIYIYI